jgi:hypothetical protein
MPGNLDGRVPEKQALFHSAVALADVIESG